MQSDKHKDGGPPAASSSSSPTSAQQNSSSSPSSPPLPDASAGIKVQTGTGGGGGGFSSLQHQQRLAAHSHIKNLGLHADGTAMKSGGGMVGQLQAREAAGLVVDLIKTKKLAGTRKELAKQTRKKRNHNEI